MKDWRGQWMSLLELSRLMGKNYHALYKTHRQYGDICEGIRVFKMGGSIKVRIDQDVYESLLRSL